jgi:hypothetical protein
MWTACVALLGMARSAQATGDDGDEAPEKGGSSASTAAICTDRRAVNLTWFFTAPIWQDIEHIIATLQQGGDVGDETTKAAAYAVQKAELLLALGAEVHKKLRSKEVPKTPPTSGAKRARSKSGSPSSASSSSGGENLQEGV